MKKELSYEHAKQELEEILENLQGEMVGMDTLKTKVERAAELIKFCKEKLRNTSDSIEKVLDSNEPD